MHTLSPGSPHSHCKAPATPRAFVLCVLSLHSPLLLLQPAKHKLHLVLEPSRVCPPLPVARTLQQAPHTAAAPPPRSLRLLCAWLPGQEGPGGLSLESCRLQDASLLPLDFGPMSLAACGAHMCGTHIHNEHGHTKVCAHAAAFKPSNSPVGSQNQNACRT